jgi:hypothetical protein
MGSFMSLDKSRMLMDYRYGIRRFGGGLVPTIMCVDNGPVP